MAETVSVHIPTALRGHVGDQARIELEGGTVREVLDRLVEQHPGLRGRLLDEGGELNRFVNVYVNDEDVRFLENLATALKAGDTVTLVPSIAGG
jgi:MoaD family protein